MTAETSPESPPVGESPTLDTASSLSSSVDRAWIARSERAILEARVAALERAVERRDRRLYRVIEQYERLLAERGVSEPERNGAVGAEGNERDGLLGRLRALR